MASRNGIMHPHSAFSPGIEPRHLRTDAAFVQINQVFRRDGAERGEKDFAFLTVLFCVTLVGVE